MPPPVNPPPSRTIAPTLPAPALERRTRRILIVDDDRLNIRILGGILRQEGYILAEADSGEHGMEEYVRFQPDLVLLDVMMPGIDGFETCRQLKQVHGDNCAPIIFITARNESDDVVTGLTAGGVDYLPKPFKARQVLARIRTHLQNQILAEQQHLLVQQLSAADAAKNRFLGMAAHDLRNPLSTIRGLAELLRESPDSRIAPADRELLDGIHETSQNMLDLVNDLLDISVIESGQLRLEPRPCILSELIEKCASQRTGDATKKKTRIVVPEAGPGIRVTIDPVKMEQVVDNLLSNAVKYSPPGSTVTVLIHGDGRHCGFAVRDEGPGIPEKERDRLFRDFGRLSAKPTGGEKSVGLGLAICRKIVEAHQGTITAENLPDRGCEFRVALPVPS